jgi:hypothetical protein
VRRKAFIEPFGNNSLSIEETQEKMKEPLNRSTTQSSSTEATPTKDRHFWTYLNGNLRSFPIVTGSAWKRYTEEMQNTLRQTQMIEMFTWQTFEHTQVNQQELQELQNIT